MSAALDSGHDVDLAVQVRGRRPVSDAAARNGQGDAGAQAGLVLLYTQHRAQLMRFLCARTGDAAEAEDIVQELWLRLRNQRVGPIANGRAYLFQMANNLALDRVRERQRRARRDRLWTETVQLEAAAQGEVAAPGPQPAEELIDQEELQQLAAAVAALPEGARRAFWLHKIEGWSHAEVAARLGISRSGVEKHIALAMRHLRRTLLG
jgi:RNA polymerase sigma factor (sigma-70 family)